MYRGLIGGLSFPKDLSLSFSTNYRVLGKLSKEGIKVEGEISGNDINYKGEDIRKLSGKYKFINEALYFTDIELLKGEGRLKGRGQFDLSSGYIEYDSELVGLRLDDISWYRLLGLGVNGDLYGEFYGSGIVED
ncbi:MAG: hypothetical protein COB48_00005, partial [Pseudoalteromonas sp.]